MMALAEGILLSTVPALPSGESCVCFVIFPVIPAALMACRASSTVFPTISGMVTGRIHGVARWALCR